MSDLSASQFLGRHGDPYFLVADFGKYVARSLVWVWLHDRGYCYWLARQITDGDRCGSFVEAMCDLILLADSEDKPEKANKLLVEIGRGPQHRSTVSRMRQRRLTRSNYVTSRS